jgi:replicative DNA helicase
MIATNQEMDLPAYLSGKGIHVYKAAGNEVTTHCFFCSDGDPKGKGKLYLNTESGLWSCKRCDMHGNRKLLLRHFGDEDDARFEFAPGTNPAMRRKALVEAAELAADMLYSNPSILEYLQVRGLSLTTIVEAKLGFAPASWSLVRELRANNTYADLRQAGISSPEGSDFFSGQILIPYISHGDVVQLRGKSPAPGGKYITPANDNARLYNAGALLGARDAFICEGEFDCYSSDTQVLTPRGWVRFDQYDGEPVAQWEEGGSITMVTPMAYTEKQADSLVHLTQGKRGGIDLLVTPGHRMVSTLADGSSLKVHRADERPSDRYHVPRVGVLDGPGIAYSDSELMLMMALSADATIDIRKLDGARYARFGFTKARKTERLCGILDELGVEYSSTRLTSGHDSVCFRVPNYIETFKAFPIQWLTEASAKQREFILSEMVEWDGNHVVSRSQVEYSTTLLANAEWMQTIAHTAGRVSTIMRRSNEYGDWFKVSVLHNKRSTSWQAIRSEEASGQTVHCVQVPSGMLLVRRDEMVAVSGNCLIVQQFLRTSTDPKMRDIAVVGLPGANALPTSFASYFENCRKVYIGLDPDPVGEKAADRIKEMLGTKARVVHLPGGLPKVDWSDYLCPKSDDHPHGGHELRDIERLIFEAEAEGRRLFTVRDAFQKWQKIETEVGGVQLGFRDLDTWIAPGLKPGQLCVPLAKTGAGKGSPLSEEICTPNGWQKWGDLQVGDEVFGRDGTPTVVTGIFDRGILPTYRVSFSDHSSLLVDGDHIWCVRQRGGHFSEWIESTMTTTELLTAELKLAPYANGRSRGWHYTIPMAAPIQYPKRHLPIEPYTLGALIANGGLTNGSAQISTPDRAVIERIRRHYDIPAWSPVLAQAGGYCPHAVVRGLIGEIRHLGLDVKSGEKFIPTDYLRGSVDQRVALLQGLMDGDGSARDKGRASVTYSTISPRLARDIRQLVTSLGGTASVRWYPNRRVGRAGRPDEATIGIMLPASIEPFHTPEKRRGSARKHTEPRRAIVSVERVWDQEIRCISVAAADHLYVVGRDHIVTHNTQWLLNVAWYLRERPTLLCSLEMSAAECYLRLKRIANFWYPLATDVDIAQLLKNLLIYDRGMQQGDLTRVAGDFTDEMGCPPQVVMVDYLGYYANRMRGNSPYERTSQAAIGLKEEAKAGEFVLLAPHQVGRGTAEGAPIELGAARDSGAVEETADLLLSLYKPGDADRTTGDIDGTVRMEALKNRNGRKNVTTSLNFSLASLVLVDKSSLASKTVNDENILIARGNTYSDVRRFRCHQAGLNQQELRP